MKHCSNLVQDWTAIGLRCKLERSPGSTWHSRSALINSPFTRATTGDEKRDKAVDHCQFPMVDNREEVTRLMGHKIRYGHFTAGDKSRQLRQQSYHDKYSANQLNPGSSPFQRTFRPVAAKNGKTLLHSMAGKEKPKNNPQGCISSWLKLLKRIHV